MKGFRKIFYFFLAIAFCNFSNAQVSLTNSSPNVLINFSSTVAGVSNGAFNGTGFTTTPSAGQLNSNAWAVSGFTPTLNFGGTGTSTQLARGASSVAVTNEGVYAFTGAPGSSTNPALMVQPSQSNFTPGSITLKIVNNGTSPITSLGISYNLFVRNDGARGNSFNFSHSQDGSLFTNVSGLDYESPATTDALGWVKVGSGEFSRSTVVTGPGLMVIPLFDYGGGYMATDLNLLPGQAYYIRWSSDRVSGNGNADDEIGLDDISITANFRTENIHYYSKATGSLSELATWGTNTDGTGAQPLSFTGNHIFHLNNRIGTQTLSSPWEFGGRLFIENNIILASNGFLRIKSYATHTGSIGTITGTGNVTGAVTVERFIAADNRRAYRMIAPSVNSTNSIRANWQEGSNITNNPWNTAGTNPNPGYGTHITGSTTGQKGFDATISGQGSLFTFDQVSATQKWVGVTNTDTSKLYALSGHLIYIRGDRSVNLTSVALPSCITTLRATGTLLTGDVTFSNLQGNGRFSFITNPYASSLSWASLIADNRTNFTENYYLWDPAIGNRGGYVNVNIGGTNSNIASKVGDVIQSGQAFFVLAKPGVGNSNITIKETHKSSNNTGNLFRTGTKEQFSIGLYFTDASGIRRNADGLMVEYNNNYSTALSDEDAEDFANWDENLAMIRNGKKLSFEGRPLINSADTISISVERLKQQDYQLQMDAFNFTHPNLQAFLADKYLGTQTPLNLTGKTVVSFTVTTDPASSAEDRFSVVFGSSAPLPVTLTNVKAFQKNSGVQVEWTVQNEINIDNYVVEHSADARTFKAIGSEKGIGAAHHTYNLFHANAVSGANYYRIKSVGKSGDIQYSQVIKVIIGKGGEIVSVYPNPVKGNNINLHLTAEKGNYNVVISNKIGQQIYNKVINHTGGSSTQSIQLNNNFGKGTYQLQLIGNGITQTLQVFKQ